MWNYSVVWNLASIPDALLIQERNRRIAVRRTKPPRARVLAPCRYCGNPLGTVERRKHEPRCPARHCNERP